jgi:hypothetical protein
MIVSKGRPWNPSIEILHRETYDKVFREHLGVIAHCCSSSSSPTYFLLAELCGFGDFENTMCDRNIEAHATTFSFAMYVIISYFALVLVLYSYMLGELSDVYC